MLDDNNSDVDIRVLSFDIDNTLIDLETLKGGFSTIWDQYAPVPDIILAYNTGRLYGDVIRLVDQNIIPSPHYIIGGVGTHIYDNNKKIELTEFADLLSEGWDLVEVEKIVEGLNLNIVRQPEYYQHAHKRSYFFEDAQKDDLQKIESEFMGSSLEVNIVYSGDKYLDVLPKWANKGNALNWLLNHLGKSIPNALVAGDSGNDVAMFELDAVNGILVSNASEELSRFIDNGKIYRAGRPRHLGVIEGLVHYHLMPDEALEIALSESR